MVSILSIISSKGDILMWEKYRRDVSKEKLNHFTYILLKSPIGSLPPVLEDDGVYSYYIKRDKLYFMMITKTKMSEFVAMKFLDNFYQLLGDFCGIITEETICRNQALIFELMTEIIDYGHIQTTSINQLQHFIYSDPVVIRKSLDKSISRKSGPFGLEQMSTSSNASNRPLVKSRSHQELHENEVFVDIVERLIVHMKADGSVFSFQVNGSIELKSFIYFNPDIRLGLNEDLIVKTHSKDAYATGIYLDQYNFHECVNTENFEKNRVITIHPPQGTVSVMNYQMESILPASIPFHLTSVTEESTNGKDLDLLLKLNCSIPADKETLNVVVHIPVPSSTKSFMQQFSMTENTAEFISAERKIIWKIKKILGQSEAIAKFKLIEAYQCEASLLQLGPVAIEFEISNFVCSGLRIRFLSIDDHRQESTHIHRWVRYATLSDSYIFKI